MGDIIMVACFRDFMVILWLRLPRPRPWPKWPFYGGRIWSKNRSRSQH